MRERGERQVCEGERRKHKGTIHHVRVLGLAHRGFILNVDVMNSARTPAENLHPR
jgi:hypothetical protein